MLGVGQRDTVLPSTKLQLPWASKDPVSLAPCFPLQLASPTVPSHMSPSTPGLPSSCHKYPILQKSLLFLSPSGHLSQQLGKWLFENYSLLERISNMGNKQAGERESSLITPDVLLHPWAESLQTWSYFSISSSSDNPGLGEAVLSSVVNEPKLWLHTG